MSMQMGSFMPQQDDQKDKPKPMGMSQRPMGFGGGPAMGGAMFPGGMRQPPFYRGGGGMGLREALGGRSFRRQGEAMGGSMQQPTPMGRVGSPMPPIQQPPARSPQPQPAQQLDSGFRPAPNSGMGISQPLPPQEIGTQTPPIVGGGSSSPPVPPVPGGGAMGGGMQPQSGKPSAPGPFYGYNSLAEWQRATFGQQF